MVKHSKKTIRRRGGAWYNPTTWFGSKTEETGTGTGTTGTPTAQSTGTIETTPPVGGPYGGRKRRSTKARSTRRRNNKTRKY